MNNSSATSDDIPIQEGMHPLPGIVMEIFKIELIYKLWSVLQEDLHGWYTSLDL